MGLRSREGCLENKVFVKNKSVAIKTLILVLVHDAENIWPMLFYELLGGKKKKKIEMAHQEQNFSRTFDSSS